MDNIRRKI